MQINGFTYNGTSEYFLENTIEPMAITPSVLEYNGFTFCSCPTI
jgi:hypothetical protein